MIEVYKQRALEKKLNIYFICEGDKDYNIVKETVVPGNPTCNCYSVAKAFTVTAIGLLYDKGLISTDMLLMALGIRRAFAQGRGGQGRKKGVRALGNKIWLSASR